jgi:histidinol dehydrogenase
MKVIHYNDPDYESQIRDMLAPSSLFDPVIEQRAKAIVDDVRQRGDLALTELTQRFDGVALAPSQFAVTADELEEAEKATPESLRKAIETTAKNLVAYSRKSLRKNWSIKNVQGGKVGEKYDPLARVGLYVPGGTAPLVSTVLMTVTLAKVAGCKEIVVCTPANKEGKINPSLLYACQIAGATKVYRLGGAQAIAAMAFGTQTIRKTQKVFGPGNAYVVAAKRLLFGYVAIDLLPGPSEVLILADDSAKAKFIAADLLAQAEHGSGFERTWFITTSPDLIPAVESELAHQLPLLSRHEHIQKALLANCWFIQVQSMPEAIQLVNQLAPEHCEIMARNATSLAKQITTAGALCLGNFTPNVLGDYVAGPSHVLPTGGAGNSFPGLTVDQFQRRSSVIQYDRTALQKSYSVIKAFADVEGLDAHAQSAAIRIES